MTLMSTTIFGIFKLIHYLCVKQTREMIEVCMNVQKEFYVGQQVVMQGAVMTIQFISGERATCSVMKGDAHYNIDVNVNLIEPHEPSDWLAQW